MINIDNVSKSFGKKEAIKNISLTIQEGESIAFCGANGSGKTTLVELICGVIKPTSGKISHSKNEGEHEKSEIGVQFQEGNWPLGTKPIDLIKFYKGRKALDDPYIKDIISIFEIESILYREVVKLSGGQKQRFNCFLSIINEPSILILDELITGLDLKMQITLTDYFKKIKKEKNTTLLIVSHIPEEIEELSDRIVILKDGSVFEDLKTKDVIKEFKTVRKKITKFFKEEIINE